MIAISYKTGMGRYGSTQIDCEKDDPKVDEFIDKITAKRHKLLSILDSKDI